MTWKFFDYELGWYAKKIYFYLPIHIIIGGLVSLPVWGILTYFSIFNSLDMIRLENWSMFIRLLLFFNSLLIGSCIEWTQIDKTGKLWSDRKVWLLGSIRDVIFYMGISWIVFL